MSDRDIVERLDDAHTTIAARGRDGLDADAAHATLDAAAEITRIRADVARLREALECVCDDGGPDDLGEWAEVRIKHARAARAALAGEAAR